jgi:hypothetical protein
MHVLRTSLLVKAATRCTSCGGAVNRDGRALEPVSKSFTARSLASRPIPAARRAPADDDDPLTELSPVERFNQAIARRDRTLARPQR